MVKYLSLSKKKNSIFAGVAELAALSPHAAGGGCSKGKMA
jgi:hypothetical protein